MAQFGLGTLAVFAFDVFDLYKRLSVSGQTPDPLVVQIDEGRANDWYKVRDGQSAGAAPWTLTITRAEWDAIRDNDKRAMSWATERVVEVLRSRQDYARTGRQRLLAHLRVA